MFSNLKGLVKKEGTHKAARSECGSVDGRVSYSRFLGESERTDADIAFESRTSSCSSVSMQQQQQQQQLKSKPSLSTIHNSPDNNNDSINIMPSSSSVDAKKEDISALGKQISHSRILKSPSPFGIGSGGGGGGGAEDSDCGSVISSTFRLSTTATTDSTDIQSRYQRVYHLAREYKIKYQQLSEAFKVMESERNNLQQLLASHQAKTSKSVEEVYKKLELDKQSKDELERDFRQLLAEKEEIIKSLRMQCDQQNINKLRSELADSKLSQLALEEQVQCLKAKFFSLTYKNSELLEKNQLLESGNHDVDNTTGATADGGDSHLKISQPNTTTTTESSSIHVDQQQQEIDESSKEIHLLSDQLKELQMKLNESEDAKKHLEKEVDNLKEILTLTQSQVNTITSAKKEEKEKETLNSELVNLQNDLSSLNTEKSQLTQQLNEAQINIEHLESIRVEHLKQIDQLKAEIKQQNENSKINYENLFCHIKQIKSDLSNHLNNDSLNLLNIECVQDVEGISNLLDNFVKVIREMQTTHNEKVINSENQLNELTDHLNKNQSILSTVQCELDEYKSKEQEQNEHINELTIKLENIQTDYINQLSNMENNLQNEIKKYTDVKLKYTEMEVEFNNIHNELKLVNQLKDDLEYKLSQQLNIQSNLEKDLTHLKQLHADDEQLKLKQDLQISNEQYIELSNNHESLLKQFKENEEQLKIEQDKLARKSNELLTVIEELKTSQEMIINLKNNHQLELDKQLNDQSIKYQLEIDSLKNEIERMEKHSNDTLDSKIECLTNENKVLSDQIQSLQQTLSSTQNQLDSLKLQYINESEKTSEDMKKHEMEEQNLRQQLSEANDSIKAIQDQLEKSMQENKHLTNLLDNFHKNETILSKENEENILELISLSNNACELLFNQSNQLTNRVDSIWNVLEMSNQRLDDVITSVDPTLKSINKRIHDYRSTIDELKQDLLNAKNELITRDNDTKDLRVDVTEKQNEISELHKELNQYKAFQETVESFLRNKHFLLYRTLINLCQSRITSMLDEINEYLNFINTTDNTTHNNNNNNYEQVSYACSQAKLTIEQLKESFNKLDKDMTQFNQFNATETNHSLELFSALIASDVFNAFTSNLNQSVNDFNTLNTKSLRELQQIYHNDIIKHSISIYQSTIDKLQSEINVLKTDCQCLTDQLAKSHMDYETFKQTVQIESKNISAVETALSEANQSIDALKQNETVLMEKYTNQVKLYEQSQQTLSQLEDQLNSAKEKSNQLSNELLEKESLINSTLEESDKTIASLQIQCNNLQNDINQLQEKHANSLEEMKTHYEEELQKLKELTEQEKSQCITELKKEHQSALNKAVDSAVIAKEKQLKQQSLELKNRLKQVLQELEISKKSSSSQSRRELDLQGSLNEVEEKLNQLQIEYKNQCNLVEQLQSKVSELEQANSELKANHSKNTMENNNLLNESLSEIHENYQMQIELMKAEHASHIQEMTKDFERKLITSQRELNIQHKTEIDETSTKLKHMEQNHTEKLSQLEETISEQERQNIKLKNCVNELQSELKRMKEVGVIEAKCQSKVNASVLSTPSSVSYHDIDVQCNLQLDNSFNINETDSHILNNTQNGINQSRSSSELNTSRYSSNDTAYDEWIEKLRQEILHSDSIDSLHPALRQTRYPTTVSIRDYEALQLHNTDLQNQLQQLSADFEELRSRCTAACGGGGGGGGSGGYKESNQHSKFTTEPLHIHTGNDSKTGQSPHSNISLNTMLSDYHHQYSNPVFSPSENRLHELVEYEYLKNVLFEYMQGRETQTLSKVLCSLMRFNADQTRKVLSYEDQKSKAWTIRAVME
ncbi:unnamed protein product [Trichobilharzia szidati]|nr:unnamed protein product [Trichobilharzia szidati]